MPHAAGLPATLLRCSLLVFVTSGVAAQQTPTLLADINQQARPSPDGQPHGFTRLGARVFFGAFDPAIGSGLFRSDGTAGGTTLVRGGFSTWLLGLVASGGKLYFVEGSPAALWVSDGTSANTRPIAGAPVYADAAMPFRGGIVYRARTPTEGRELWFSDGTSQGTRVFDFDPGIESGLTRILGVVANEVWFVGWAGAGTPGVFRTDLTPAGTTRVGGTELSPAQALFEANGRVYLGLEGAALWESRGLPGTNLLLGRFPSSVPRDARWSFWPDPTRAGLYLVLDTSDFFASSEVWHLAFATSSLARVLQAGNSIGSVAPLPNGDVILGADVDLAGLEPWTLRGTSASRIADIMPAREGSRCLEFVPFGNGVVFQAEDPLAGWELWFSDGTAGGTRLLADILPGPDDSRPIGLFLDAVASGGNGQIWFECDDGTTGRELFWLTPRQGVTHVDVAPPPPGTRGSSPRVFGEVLGTTYLMADDGVNGFEPWVTDGTPAGTRLLVDATLGSAGSGAATFHAVGDTVMFAAGRALWRTDGTPGNTLLVRSFPYAAPAYPSWLTVAGDVLYFVVNDPAGAELWRSDGTAAGTRIVFDLVPGALAPRFLTALGDRLVFEGQTPGLGPEVWVSDGTAAGTRSLGRSVHAYGANAMLRVRDRVLFLADSPGTGVELWSTDGSVQGTALVRDVYPGPQSSGAAGFVRAEDRVFFAASHPVSGRELWVTDGTPAGTRLVLDQVGADLNPSRITAVGPRVFFEARNPGGTADVPWVSDGTAAGTFDLGVTPRALHFATTGARNAWFGARTAWNVSPTLWRSDGSTTVRVTSLGDRGGYVIGLGNGELIFSVDDALLGEELFVLDPGASSLRVGQGCGAGPRVPALELFDPVLGASATIRGHGTVAGTVGQVLFGPPAASPARVGGCDLQIASPSVALPPVAVSGPTWQQTLPIPASPALRGLRLNAQAAFVGSTAARGFELSNAIGITVGN